jgi:hypothetical protein
MVDGLRSRVRYVAVMEGRANGAVDKPAAEEALEGAGEDGLSLVGVSPLLQRDAGLVERVKLSPPETFGSRDMRTRMARSSRGRMDDDRDRGPRERLDWSRRQQHGVQFVPPAASATRLVTLSHMQ